MISNTQTYCSTGFTTLRQALNSKNRDLRLEFSQNEVMDMLQKLEDKGTTYLAYIVN
jgi:hypothetical protein